MHVEPETLVLLAPFAGWCTSLDDLPDPVFAGRMLGDGVAIDPLEPTLHAPCDGEVIALPASRHAITLRAANGKGVLTIDTATLNGVSIPVSVLQEVVSYYSRTPDQPVVIAADKDVRYEAVLEVMDMLQQNQVKRIGLLAKPRTP